MAKDPFAKPQSKEYRYDDTCIIPRTVTGADGETTFDLREEYGLTGEDTDGVWLRLRLPNRKADQSRFAEIAQTVTVVGDDGEVQQRQRIATAGRTAFLQVVEAWSFEREPTGEAYDALEAWASVWVDQCVADAWQTALARVQKKDVGLVTLESSPKPLDPEEESAPLD